MKTTQEDIIIEKLTEILSNDVRNPSLHSIKDIYDIIFFGSVSGPILKEAFSNSILMEKEQELRKFFSPLSVTSHLEAMWQLRMWPEATNQEFQQEADPNFRNALAGILVFLEKSGAISEPKSGTSATSLANAYNIANAFKERGVTTVGAGKLATALKLASENFDGNIEDLDWRMLGHRNIHGQENLTGAEALNHVIKICEETGILSAIDRSWNRGAGGGKDHLKELASAMLGKPQLDVQTSQTIIAVEDLEPQKVKTKPGLPKNGEENVKYEISDNNIEVGILLLSQGLPGSSAWFGGLVKVLSSKDQRFLQNTDDLCLDVPEDERAELTWSRLAKKNGLETSLSEALSEARTVLRMQGFEKNLAPM